MLFRCETGLVRRYLHGGFKTRVKGVPVSPAAFLGAELGGLPFLFEFLLAMGADQGFGRVR